MKVIMEEEEEEGKEEKGEVEEDDDDEENEEKKVVEKGRDRDGSVGEGGAVRRIPLYGDEEYRKRAGVRAFARTCVRAYVRACVRASGRACARTPAWANTLCVSVPAARMVKEYAKGRTRVRRATWVRRWCPEDRDSSRELQGSVRERIKERAIARANRRRPGTRI